MTDRHTDGHRDRPGERQTDSRTYIKTDRCIDILAEEDMFEKLLIDREIDIQTDSHIVIQTYIDKQRYRQRDIHLQTYI